MLNLLWCGACVFFANWLTCAAAIESSMDRCLDADRTLWATGVRCTAWLLARIVLFSMAVRMDALELQAELVWLILEVRYQTTSCMLRSRPLQEGGSVGEIMSEGIMSLGARTLQLRGEVSRTAGIADGFDALCSPLFLTKIRPRDVCCAF